jgi:subtilisin family serine protease
LDPIVKLRWALTLLEIIIMAPTLQFPVRTSHIRLIVGKDPMDCQGHGTHVAGIIAAEALSVNAPYPFIGVAPNVTLGMWRVFGCTGSTTTDVIIDAMTQAHAAGVDIISMSLGGHSGWSEDPRAVVASRIADRGVFMSISAGNDGSQGLLLAETISSGLDVAAVASVDTITYFAFLASVGPEARQIV